MAKTTLLLALRMIFSENRFPLFGIMRLFPGQFLLDRRDQARIVGFHGGGKGRLLPAASPYANFRKYWDSKPGLSALPRLLFADQKTYLVELLMKQDQMSMATSVESRVPFLDHEFVEFSTRVPQHMKLRHGEGKYIVKKAIEGLV